MAAKGMAWAIFSVLVSKVMTFASQIVLGYLLSAQTYGAFAIASMALSLTAGFQNAGVSKALIQQKENFDGLVGNYAAFSLYLGAIGGVLLVAASFALAATYQVPQLVEILCVSAISIPVMSLSAIYSAKLSNAFRFRDLQMAGILVAFLYNAALITLAYLGFDYMTIAAATVLSQLVGYLLYVRMAGRVTVNYRLSLRTFSGIFVSLRWLIFISFLFGLMRNGDYLVLGHLVSQQELGYYYFGFMLTANIGVLLTTAINQTFLPLFSSIKEDAAKLQDMIAKIGVMIGFLCGMMCLVAVGLLPQLIHFVWASKWDQSTLTAVAMAIALPLRIYATLGTVTMEAKGRWRMRAGLLVADAVGIMAAAGLGAALGGYEGAAIAVALETALSGVLIFPLAARQIGMSVLHSSRLQAKTALPFLACAAALYFATTLATPELGTVPAAAIDTISTGIACVAYLCVALIADASLLSTLKRYLRK